MGRRISSYGKVQLVYAKCIRGHAQFIRRKRIAGKKLLNVGCGPNPAKQFINLDYNWYPAIDICWDITRKPYPIEDKSLEGIFTEHCLEHISFADCQTNLLEFRRMLKPGGTLRIVMPDAELYVDLYQRQRKGEQIKMPHQEGYVSGMARINGLFRNHGHQFIYDFETLQILLQNAGFTGIKKESFRHGRDQRLLIDMEWRADESLYVEATA